MSAGLCGALLIAGVCASAGVAPTLPGPLDGLEDHLSRAFGGWNVALHSLSVASTVALSASGGDHALRVAFQGRLAWRAGGDLAVTAGFVLPPLVPGFLWGAGLVTGDASFASAGSAALQALSVTLVTTAILKVGTGRPFPLQGGDPRAPDRLEHPEYAREWEPFSFRGRYAWPSGHTAAAFSVASALSAHADSVVVPVIAYPLAVGIGAGMLVGDHHWASDVLAGALLGHTIGWSVGTGFHTRRSAARGGDGAAVRLVPFPAPGPGLALTGAW